MNGTDGQYVRGRHWDGVDTVRHLKRWKSGLIRGRCWVVLKDEGGESVL